MGRLISCVNTTRNSNANKHMNTDRYTTGQENV